MVISRLVNSVFGIYWWIIIVRIFLTWIPSINWDAQPYRLIRSLVDPVLAPFRALIPSFGGLDFSPIVAILCIQFAQTAIVRLLMNFGL